jgi:DNA-binding response OmpR family regulator
MRDMANPPADGGLADMPPLEQLSSNGLVLLLCGDAERAASWAGGLDRAGFPVDTVAQLSRDQARVGAADVLVLDIPTRLAEAATTIRWWRDGGLTAYVLALVAADDGTAASVCVDAGADAWANRECSTRELIARVRATSSHVTRSASAIYISIWGLTRSSGTIYQCCCLRWSTHCSAPSRGGKGASSLAMS